MGDGCADLTGVDVEMLLSSSLSRDRFAASSASCSSSCVPTLTSSSPVDVRRELDVSRSSICVWSVADGRVEIRLGPADADSLAFVIRSEFIEEEPDLCGCDSAVALKLLSVFLLDV